MKPIELSCLIDGDFEPGAIGLALAALAGDPAARETVTLHQLVGDALRGRVVEDDGYSRRILASLDGERIAPA